MKMNITLRSSLLVGTALAFMLAAPAMAEEEVEPKPEGTAGYEEGTETETSAQQEEEVGTETEMSDEQGDVEPKPEGTAGYEEGTETETSAQQEEEVGTETEMSDEQAEGTDVEPKPEGTAEYEEGTETETTAQQEEAAGSLGSMPADDLIGKDVVNENGEEVGSIEDIVRDDEQAYAVVSVGGFLGIEDKEIAVPFDHLELGEEDAILMSEASEEELESMADYEEGMYESVPGDEPANPVMGE